MMTKTNEERNNYQKIKYHERKAKAKFIKNLLTGIIIALMVGFFLYANSIRETNAKTADTISGVRDEINSLRKSVQTQFESVGGKLLEQDKKIEGVKQSKAEQKQKQSIALVQKQRTLSGGCEQYRGLVSQYPWNVDIALAVMRAESGCNPGVLSRTADRGLMQINQVHAAKVGGNLNLLFDPVTNLRVAYQLYQASGWSPWSVCTKGIVKCI